MIYPCFEGYPEFMLTNEPQFLKSVNGITFHLNACDYCIVPAGTLWNGASIPLVLQYFFPAIHPRYNRASLFHDGACGEKQERITAFVNGEHRKLTWAESAKWFKAALQAEGVPKWKRVLFYEAVMLKKRPKKWLRL